MSSAKPVLLLLGRPECHLCEDFRAGLEEAFPGRFDVREACVDDRADWQARFGAEIPVLIDEAGQVICRTHFDPGAVSLLYGE